MDLGGNYGGQGYGGFGGYSGQQRSFLKKLNQRFSQSPMKVKGTVFTVFLVLFYWVFFSGGKAQDELVNSYTRDNSQDYTTQGGIDTSQIQTVNAKELTIFELSKPYVNPAKLQLDNYMNGGNMMIRKDSDYLRLTAAKRQQVGYIFSNNRISTEDSDAMEIEIEFRIHGEQSKSSLIGDGLAIWLTESQLVQGDVFGMQSDYNGLGIFLDTYRNSQKKRNTNSKRREKTRRGASRHDGPRSIKFPYISLQDNNGMSNKYDRFADGEPTELAGCPINKVYNLRDENHAKLRVIYIRKLNYLSVEFTLGGEDNDAWVECFTLDNDSGVSFNIPKSPYLGISAETGELFANVDLYEVKVYSLRDKATGLPIDSVSAVNNFLEIEDIDTGASNTNSDSAKERIDRRRERRESKLRNQMEKKNQRRKFQQMELNSRSRLNGNEDQGWVRYLFGLVWVVVKYIFFLILILVVLYLLLLSYRLYNEKKRKKRSASIL